MKPKEKIKKLPVALPVVFKLGPMKSGERNRVVSTIEKRRFISLELSVSPFFEQALCEPGPMTLELIIGDKKVHFTR